MEIKILSPERESQLVSWRLMGVTSPKHGTAVVNEDQTVTYTPNIGYVGNDEFEYIVRLTHEGGAVTTETASVKLTITESETTVTAVISGKSELTCSDPIINLAGTNSTGDLPLTYSWYTGDGNILGSTDNSFITLDQPGTYSLTVTDYGGRTATSNKVITENTVAPTVVVNKLPDTNEIGITHQVINLDASESVVQGVPYYTWSTGATGSSIDVTQPGTYSVTVQDSATGCTATEVIEIIGEIILPQANVTGVDQLSCLTTSIVLDGTSSTGTGITYLWTTPDGNIITNPTEPIITVDQGGTYTLTVTDIRSNESSAVAEIVDVTTNVNVTINTEDLELSEQVNIIDLNTDISGTSSAEYYWSTGEVTPSISITEEGTYTVTVTDVASGCTASDTVVITRYIELPVATITGHNNLDYNNPTGTMTGSTSTGEGTLTYSWTTSNGGNITSGASTDTITYDSAGTYRLSVTDMHGNIAIDEVVITENFINPVVDAGTASAQLTCAQPTLQLNGTATSSNPTANLSYSWSGGVIDSGADTLTPTISDTGIYLLEVTDNDNGAVATDTVQVTGDTALPYANAGNNVTLTCTDPTKSLQATATLTGCTYSWSGGTVVSGGDTLTPVVSQGGIYTLTVTKTSTGCTATDTVEVIESFQVPDVYAGENVEYTGSNVTIPATVSSSNPNANLHYQWTALSGTILSGVNTASVTVQGVGDYRLTVTDLNNGCTAFDDVSVIASVPPTVTIDPVTEVLNCSNTSVTVTGSAVSSNPTASFTYNWTGGTVSGSRTGTSIEATSAGTYRLTVTDTDNGTSNSAVVSVTSNSVSPSISAGSNFTLNCNNPTRTMNATATSTNPDRSFAYSWTTSDGNFTTATDIRTPTVDSAGTYTLTVTDTNNGCSSTDSVVISENFTSPNAVITSPTTVLTLNTTSIQLDGSNSTTASGSKSYRWYDGSDNLLATTATRTVTSAGTYKLTVIDGANGCEDQTTIVITENTVAPTVSVSFQNIDRSVIDCGQTVVVLTSSVSSSNPNKNFSYSWTGGSTTGGRTSSTLSASSAATYTLTVTDTNNGASASDSITVTENLNLPNISFTTSPSDGIITNANPTVSITANTDASNPTYSWSTSAGNIISGQGTNTIVVNKAATYRVDVTDGVNECEMGRNIVINWDTVPVNSSITGQSVVCPATYDVRSINQVIPETYINIYYDDSGSMNNILPALEKALNEPQYLETLLVPFYDNLANYRSKVTITPGSQAGGLERSLKHLNINGGTVPVGSKVISIVFQDEAMSDYYSNVSPLNKNPNYDTDYSAFKTRLDGYLKGIYNGVIIRMGNDSYYRDFLTAIKEGTGAFANHSFKDYPEIAFRGIPTGVEIPPSGTSDSGYDYYANLYLNEIKAALESLGFVF